MNTLSTEMNREALKMSQKINDTEVFEVISSSDRARMEREVEEQLTMAEKQTAALFEEINGKFEQQVGTLSIHRQNDTNQLDFLERFPSDKFTDEEALLVYMKKTYGAGDYRIHGRIPGRKGLAINKLITIGKTLEEMEDDKIRRRGGMPAIIPEGENSQLMMLILEGQRSTQEMFRQMMERQERRSANLDFLKNPETLAILVPAFSTLLASIIDNRKKANDPVMQLKNLMEIKTMMEGDKKPEEEKSFLETIGEVGAGILQNLNANKTPAQVTHRPTAPPDAMARVSERAEARYAERAEQAEKWDADRVASELEYAVDDIDLNDSEAVIAVRDRIIENAAGMEAILEGIVYVEPSYYDRLKPVALTHFQLPADLINRIEHAREEQWGTDDDRDSPDGGAPAETRAI